MAGSTLKLVRPEEASWIRSAAWSSAAVLHRPQHREQRARTRLEQRRNVDVMRPEADAERAHAGPRFLVEAAHFLGDLGAVDHAEILDQAEGDAPRRAASSDLAAAEIDQRLEERLDAAGEPEVDARLHPLARAGGERIVGEQDEAAA